MNSAFSQTVEDTLKSDINDQPPRKVRNVIGFMPSKVDAINGLALGYELTLGINEEKKDSVIINGLCINLAPMQIIFGAMAIPYLISAPFSNSFSSDTINPKFENRLNGISIGIFESSDRYVIHGLQISGLFHKMYKLHGLSITLGAGVYNSFDGVMISGYINNTQKGKGLQIGLINKTESITGVQIGLWNKIGKRGLPIINMSFKKKKPDK